MHKILEESHDDLIVLRLSGQLNKDDYAHFIPFMEEKIKRYGKIRLYWEMNHFEGWTIAGIWEDLKFDLRHFNHFKKIAMVGQKQWHDWMTTLMKPFTSAEVKYFDLKEHEKAMEWVKK